MTRTELEQVRTGLDRLLHGLTIEEAEVLPWETVVEGAEDALRLIDAELAKPEAREWRVLAEDHSQFFWRRSGSQSEVQANRTADWLRTNDAGNVYVDSRTVGPWERAE